MKTLGIVLVLYRQKHNLETLYSSLSGQTFKDFKIYFVDNNTNTEETEYSKDINKNHYQLDIEYIKENENTGFAGGSNRGARAALSDGYKFIFFLNNDMKLENNCLEELLRVFNNDQTACVAGPIIFYASHAADPLIQEFGAHVDFKKYRIMKIHEGIRFKEVKNSLPDVQTVDLVSGGAMLVKAEVFKQCGFWEESFFAYGDEIDFAKRINDKGCKTIVTSRAMVWHKHEWDMKNKNGYYFEYYLSERNKFLYLYKYKFRYTLLLLAFEDIIKFPRRLVWFKKVCDLKLGFYYLKGMIDGLLNKKGKPKFSFVK